MTLQTCSFEGDTLDSLSFRQALGRFATGVAVITTRTMEGKLEGVTANSFAAVSLDPPLVLWSLRRNASAFESFCRSGMFAVNVLAADQRELARQFAKSSTEKFTSIPFTPGLGGSPIFAGCLTTLECQVQSTTDGGDHLIFIGRVLRALMRHGDPLIFSAGQYCRSAAFAD
jgi:flavin reductase (DIM6/NTAB) family NADH-FMN oxidoreductase RutF